MKKHILAKIILVLLFTIMLIPTWFMLVGSFQNLNGIMTMPPKLWPKTIIITNYLSLLKYPVLTWFINTMGSLCIIILLSVFLSISSGYFFATSSFKGKEILWTILLVGLLLPRISFLIPSYIIIKKLHLSGTLLAVILSTSFSSFGMLLARNYFEAIPKTLFEAAMIDGADDMQILFKIVAPMSPPVLATLALSTSIFFLTDFIWQMLILQKEGVQTLLIGLIKAVQQFSGSSFGINPLGRMMAVGITLFIPLLLIFLIANKYFISMRGGEIKE